ncbi:FecR domain-containing protein [Dyadobacter sp. LJ53]|uniref:FecR family protein n=1 Tax=Dyadobacter chenwenxiniae TaxID=2906456 RepID=UPI001F348876|nr:FecR family protein [Dyadobacter chenwenxiniae]MCF0050837.1 FecR domain-containing protein [Dyadobacter chenwenxiniae]
MDYRYYTAEELATDDLFREWVISPTPEVTSFWLKWIAENPEKSGEVGMARELVLTVYDMHNDQLTEEALQQEIEEITRLAGLRKQDRGASIYPLLRQPVWRVVAIFLLVSALGLWLYKRERNTGSPAAAHVSAARETSMLERKNDGFRELTVLLSDNSIATLSPGSMIRYPKSFDASERKIILSGEAFFDVAKNPERPFLVYANETVTKVLGTSFRVKALDQENTVMVLVKTGRVSVYPKTAYETLQSKPEVNVSVIVLDPNQQAVFNRKENKLEKGTVVNRQLLSELSVQKELIFDDKPVSDVFKALQDIYGIEISYNQEMLANCMISAQFSDENLKQRLNAVCQAIGAGYDMVDGRIVISGKGCNQ